MSINITSDAIVKILIRKGSDADRKNTILSTGELGYATDTGIKRLFVGDGTTAGGNPVGVKNFGYNTAASVTSQAYPGDLVYDTTNFTLYGRDSSNSTWNSLHPVFDNTIQQLGNGKWSVNANNITVTLSSLNGLSANDFTANNINSQYINLVHPAANDGINPILFIGEGDKLVSGSLSGFITTYDEINNKYFIITQFGNTQPLTAFTIDQLGNVGINTIYPSQSLTVAGNISATGGGSFTGAFTTSPGNSTVVQINGNSTGTGNADLLINRTGVTETAGAGNGANVQFGNSTNSTAALIQHYNNNLQFLNYTGGGWNERMRILSSGNVGIGTTLPSQALSVAGSISASNTVFAPVIATTAGASNGAIIAYDRNNTAGNTFQMFKQGGLNSLYDNNGGTVMSLLSSGQVGIGTTTPNAKLTVVGDISASNVYSNGTLLTNAGSISAQYQFFGAPSNIANPIQIPIQSGHLYAVEAWYGNVQGSSNTTWTIGLSSTTPSNFPFANLYATGIYSPVNNWIGASSNTSTYGTNSVITGFTLTPIAQTGNSSTAFIKLNAIFLCNQTSTITLLLSSKAGFGSGGYCYMSVTTLS